MKKLLLLLMCVLTAVGVRAEKTYLGTDDAGWYALNAPSVKGTQALTIDISGIVTYSDSPMLLHEAEPGDQYTYWYGKDSNGNTVSVPGGEVTIDLTNHSGELQEILTEAMQRSDYYNKVKITGTLTSADMAALSLVDAKALDLSDATFTNTDIESVTNTKVKFLALPAGQTRDDVYETEEIDTGDSWRVITKTSDEYKLSDGIVNGESLSGFSALYSAVSVSGDATSGRTVTAYNGKAGTLQAAIVATGDYQPYYDDSSVFNGRQYYYSQLNSLKGIILSGEANAFDICGGTNYNKLDENGHLAWDRVADENNAGTDQRQRVGTEVRGALNAHNWNVEVIDFEKAIFRTNSDMTISNSGVGLETDHMTKLVLPTSPLVTEIPAYFSTTTAGLAVLEICIPSNIEVIRTHAFTTVFHIWTTAAEGDIDNTIYDNGIYDYDTGKMLYGVTGVTKSATSKDDSNMPRYGSSFTFSSNLKLIESHAFSDSNSNVKDVYVLSEEAPECHVDAFSTQMYMGINGFGNDAVDGIIARESYRNSQKWITMLHYPRNTTTPDIQRYTDPTRKYTIASTDLDSKGNTIYFPTQSEFNAAFGQGTTGYLWNAWDPTIQYGQLWNNYPFIDGWSTENQQGVNNYVVGETNQNDLENYPWVSFYDVTDGGKYAQPEGVIPYYLVNWDGSKNTTASTLGNLYPKIATAVVSYNYVADPEGIYVKDGETYREATAEDGDAQRYSINQVPATDAWGNIIYEQCTTGSKVKDYTYVPDVNGTFVENYVQDASGNKVLDYNWVKDNTNGTHVMTATSAGTYSQTTHSVAGATYYLDANGTTTTPTVDAGYYYHSDDQLTFSAEVWEPQTVNGELITTYYNVNGQETQMKFNSTKWYDPQEGEEEVLANDWNLVNGVSQLYDWQGNAIDMSSLNITLWNNNLYTSTDGTTFVSANGTKYNPSNTYYLLDGGTYKLIYDTDGNGDIASGIHMDYTYMRTQTTTKCTKSTDYWIPTVTEYYNNQTDTTPYYSGTGAWPGGAFAAAPGTSSGYYYATGSTPIYGSAENTDYDENETYYTDAAATSVATTVNFASPVYIEDINYSYTEATGSEPAGTDLYRKAYTGTFRDAVSPDDNDEQHFTYVDGTYRTYEAATDAHFTRYKKVYGTTYRDFDASIDKTDEQLYCPQMTDDVAESVVTKKNDYRGWHQFVLTGYADPTTDIIINHNSYVSDNDWWTICLPYDLNYKEMMLFYGDPEDETKIPYLALLTNVVRDLGEQTITLNFSENLMTHKAYRTNGVWTVTNEAPSKAADAGKDDKVNETDNDIVLHAGVPYLIRPYRVADSNGNFNTQFDIYGQENVNASLSEWRVTATTVDYPLLYTKMQAAQDLGSYDAMALVEKGIYTVPALVKNNDAPAEGVEAEGVSSTKLDVKINSEIENLPISTDWDYSFVGNLYYNSYLPQNSYFLGWYEKARFFYADYTLEAVTDMSDKNYKFVNLKLWNNNTCIICPNMLSSSKHHTSAGGTIANTETQTYLLGKGGHEGLITEAVSGANGYPAQWLIGRTATNENSTSSALANDWFSGGSAPQHAAAANPVLMDFGITNMAELTGIEEVKTETKTIPAINDNKVYTIDGRYVGNSIEGLGKGLYILNGKKVVVK